VGRRRGASASGSASVLGQAGRAARRLRLVQPSRPRACSLLIRRAICFRAGPVPSGECRICGVRAAHPAPSSVCSRATCGSRSGARGRRVELTACPPVASDMRLTGLDSSRARSLRPGPCWLGAPRS
jgi:hypothetical protein